MNIELTPAMLRRLLRYDARTGKLWWRWRTPDMFTDRGHSAAHQCAKWNSCFAGKEALTGQQPRGYKRGTVAGHVHYAHRVIWAMQTGKWPEHDIDHEDTDPSNNRWGNLREATPSQNGCNTGLRRNNTSGFKGVHWNKHAKKWHAQIRGGKVRYLGLFNSAEEAHAAYCAAADKHHEEFANDGTLNRGAKPLEKSP